MEADNGNGGQTPRILGEICRPHGGEYEDGSLPGLLTGEVW
jgi:hypothetical protein